MPVYEYKCSCSDKVFEFKRAFSDPEVEYNCPLCNGLLTRYYSPTGVQFKGKGFYSTDYGKKK